MDPFILITSGFMEHIWKLATAKLPSVALGFGWDKAKKYVIYPFKNAIQSTRSKKRNWTGALDEIEYWWDHGELPTIVNDNSTKSINELAALLAERFESYTNDRHLASTSLEVFLSLLCEWQIQVEKSFPEEASRISLARELEQNVAVAQLQSNNISVLVDDSKDRIESTTQSLSALIEELKSSLTETITNQVREEISSKSYHDELTRARTLLEENEVSAGLSLLKDLRSRIAAGADKTVSYRLFINLGACYVRLENYPEARHCFETAVSLCPEIPKGQANLANLDYIEHLLDQAHSRVTAIWEKDHSEDLVLAVLIVCLTDRKEFSAIDRLVEEHGAYIVASSSCTSSLAFSCIERRDFAEAERYFRLSCGLDENNLQARIMIARCRLQAIASHLHGSDSAEIESAVEQRRGEIVAAVSLATDAIEFAKRGTDRSALARGYVSRAAARMIAGDFDDAMADCDRAEESVPSRLDTLAVRARLLIQKDEFEKVTLILGKRRDLRVEDKKLVGYCYYRLREFDSAVMWFEKCPDLEQQISQESKVMLHAMWFSGQCHKVITIAAGLRLVNGLDVDVMKMELSCLFRSKRWGDALGVLRRLRETQPENVDHLLNILAMNMNLGRDDAENLPLYRSAAMEALADLAKYDLNDDPWAESAFVNLLAGIMKMSWLTSDEVMRYL